MKPNPYARDGWNLEHLPEGEGYRLTLPLSDRPLRMIVSDNDLDVMRTLAAHRDLSPPATTTEQEPSDWWRGKSTT